MTNKLSLAVLFLAAFILNCASSNTVQILKEDYQSPSKNFNASVTILPFTEEIVDDQVLRKHLSNKDNSRSIISTANKSIYENYFGLIFSETVTGTVNDLVSSNDLDFVEETEFVDTTIVLSSKRNLSILAPKKGKLHSEETPTDYTLLTQSLNWQIEYVESQSRPIGGTLDKQVDFTIQLKYVLWDNNRERIVGYGFINEKRNLARFPNRGFYIQFFEELSRMIVSESPMQIRYS